MISARFLNCYNPRNACGQLLPGQIDEIYPISTIILGRVQWTRLSTSGDPNGCLGWRLGQRHLLDHQGLKVLPLALQRSDPASGKPIGLDCAAE